MFRMGRSVGWYGLEQGYRNNPGFAVNREVEIGPVWPAAAGWFGRAFKTAEQYLQPSILEGGSAIQQSRLRRKLHIDCFTVDLIGDLKSAKTLARACVCHS